jgi:hypothetical protein
MEINKRDLNDDKNKLEQSNQSFVIKLKNKFIRNLKFHYKYIILLTIVLVIILLLPNNKTKCKTFRGGAFENGVQTMTMVTEKILGFYLVLGLILLLPIIPVVAYVGLIFIILKGILSRVSQT